MTNDQLREVVALLQRYDQFRGSPVGYHGGLMSRTLFAGNSSSPNYQIAIIIEELDGTFPSIGQNIREDNGQPASPQPIAPSIANNSHVGAELIGAGFSCLFASISVAGVVGGLLAEAPSAGTSTVVVVAAWTGAVTGSVQCVNGLYRSGQAVFNPTGTELNQLDHATWYQRTTFWVDAAGVVSGIAGMSASARTVLRVLEQRAALPTAEALEQLTRDERRVAIQAALQRASTNPATRRELEQALQQAMPGRNIAALIANGNRSIRVGGIVSNVISQQLAQQISSEIRAIYLTRLSMAINILPSDSVGSASGSLNTTANLVINIISRNPS